MNVCYLKFINFSLGASCMIRQNLQLKNNTVSVNLFHRITTKLWLYLTDSAYRLHTMDFLDEDANGRFRNTLQEQWMSALIPSPCSLHFLREIPRRDLSCLFDHTLSCLFSAARSNASMYQLIPCLSFKLPFYLLCASLTLK